MSNQLCAQPGEQKWVGKRGLQQEVLLYLRENGRTSWAALYLHFTRDGEGEIGTDLGLLARWKHITVGFDGYAEIAAAGIERLSDGK